MKLEFPGHRVNGESGWHEPVQSQKDQTLDGPE